MWMKTAAERFADYINKQKSAVKKMLGGTQDPLQWKGHGPTIIRQDFWDAMCDQWARPEFQVRSQAAAGNRGKVPEANIHTGGSISFRSHKNRLVRNLF